MKNNILPWQITGFAVTSIGGTLLHFLYDWSGQNRFAAIFSGVNESTWEHMKLLFFPMFAFALIQSFFFKENSAFFCIKLRGNTARSFTDSRAFLHIQRRHRKIARLG